MEITDFFSFLWFASARWIMECQWRIYSQVNNTRVCLQVNWGPHSSSGELLDFPNKTMYPKKCIPKCKPASVDVLSDRMCLETQI